MQFILETIRLGVANLRLHLTRSILTALGIILGVAAVITMVALGEGAKREALAQIERLGAKNIIVRSQKPPETQNQNNQKAQSWTSKYGLTRDDLDVIIQSFPDASSIVPLKEVGSQLLRAERRKTSQAYGTTPDLLRAANLRVDRGRYLNDQDLEQRSMVCVVGSEIAKEFFQLEDPVGATLRIDDKVLTVIGVLAPVGLSGGAGASLVGRDLNLDVHIPITTARSVFGDLVARRTSGSFSASEVQIAEIYLIAPTTERVLIDGQRVRRILEVRHPKLDDIGIIVPYELLEQKRRAALTYTLVLSAIAAISLLVGGIGIMNIMLATVTERTREIGIRRAVGATRRHILWQFLVETSVLSAIGGLIGVGLGIGTAVFLSWGVPRMTRIPLVGSYFSTDMALPTHITLWSIILAFSVAAATGLIFGVYPARKAARQDPIVALRHD